MKVNLTDRQFEIFKLLIAGMTMIKISGLLKLHHQTIKYHTRNIYDRLGVKTRFELIAKFREAE